MKSSNIEKQKFNRTYGKKIKSLLIFSLFCLLLGLFFELLNNQDLFKIKEIKIEGAQKYVNKNDLQTLVLANIDKKSFFKVNTTQMEKDIKSNFLVIKEVKVTKNVRGFLTIRLLERKPIAILSQKNNTYVIDDEGFVLGYMDPSNTNLPKINYDEELKIGYFVDKNLVSVYSNVIDELDSKKIKISSISMNAFDVRMFVENGTEVLVSKKNYDASFSSKLNEILSYLKTSGKKARSIDLRYDKVVISF